VDSGWIVPAWPAPLSVHAACSTRAGGVSVAPYDTFNLGDHVGDDGRAVAANRGGLAQAIGVHPVFLQQVHGSGVVQLDRVTPDGTQADGCITTSPGVACTIMVADCLPVLFATSDGRAVGAAHAGWRGLAGADGVGILEAVARALWDASGMLAVDAGPRTLAWLGPCIGPQAFEVGDEVKTAFQSRHAEAAAMFKPTSPGKWLADLPGLARLRLAALGITRVHGNDGGAAWCSVSNPSRFFSHRRDRVSGRFAAAIWLA
jgi:YfiH family protein